MAEPAQAGQNGPAAQAGWASFCPAGSAEAQISLQRVSVQPGVFKAQQRRSCSACSVNAGYSASYTPGYQSHACHKAQGCGFAGQEAKPARCGSGWDARQARWVRESETISGCKEDAGAWRRRDWRHREGENETIKTNNT
ncbi:MAG: hypothetical protein AB1390_11005 [Nitrospirota bacterium]